MASFDVCVIGSANLDLVATTDRLPAPGESVIGQAFAEHAGGKGLNQAVAASRAGARVALGAAVGADDAGRQLLEVMDAAAVNRSMVVQRADVPTGRALIGVSSTAENSIIVVPGANASLSSDEVAQAARAATVVLLQLEVPLATVHAALQVARDAGALTILNPAPAATLDPATLALCDIVVPNEHEVDLLGGAPELLRRGATAVVITLGAQGARLCRSGRDDVVLPAFAVDAVDTTAAGDAFCGGLATALATGSTIDEALPFAAATAALATTKPGAVPSLPHRIEIDALLNARA